METLLKSTFPEYRIYDASKKTDKEREFAVQLCIQIPSILMFVIRNKKNEKFFKKYEKKHVEKKIGILFYNKDDYVFFRDAEHVNSDYKGVVLFLRNFLKKENECCICYEGYDSEKRNLLICDKCGNCECRRCVFAYLEKTNENDMNCPVCKNFVLASITL